MVLYTRSKKAPQSLHLQEPLSFPSRAWACLLPLYSPLWVFVVNHVLAAGCQLVDGLGVVGQGLLQYLMLLHFSLGTQLVLGDGTEGIREERSSHTA